MEVLLANPRGFCAGVERAISIVERALQLYGAPIYVRHEVVHNKFVVEDLRAKGAVFVEELEQVPAGSTVIFSAHGVSPAIRREAEERGLKVFDATCPLVTKVHVEVAKMREQGRGIVMIGHRGHPEVEGTMGQATSGMYLVETVADVEAARGRGAGPACLRHPDHAVGGRRRGHRRRAQAALSVHRRSEEGRHLLRHAESPGCGEIPGAAMRSGDRGRLAQQLELQPPARSGADPGRGGAHDRRRVGTAPGMAAKGASASASAPAPRRRKCW